MADDVVTSSEQQHEASSSNVDEDVCRICRAPAEPNRPLFHPCSCSGSIKFVHEDCLMGWIKHSNSKNCELCKKKFTFQKIYAENTPQKLSVFEILVGIMQIASNSIAKLARVLLVVLVWLLVLPTLTAWVWHCMFAESFAQCFGVYKRLFVAADFFKDIILGSFLSALILCLGLSAAAFREFIVNNRDLLNMEDNPNRIQRNNLDAGNNNANNNNAADNVVQNQEPANNADPAEELSDSDESDNLGPGNNADALQPEAVPVDPEVEIQDDHPPAPQPAFVNNAQAEANNILDQNNVNVPAGMIDGGALPQENNELDFEELVGLTGSLGSLLGTFLVVASTNIVCLNMFIFLPYRSGKYTLQTYYYETPVVGADLLHVVTSILCGYLVLMGLSLSWIGFSLVLYYVFKRPFDPITTAAIRVAKYVYTFAKLVTMISMNFVMSPCFCGAMLNLATAEFFDKTVYDRFEQFKAEPVSTFIVHWMMGVALLYLLSSVVRILREFLRPGVLWFLNNPDDPNFSYLREVVRTPVLTQARRIVMTFTLFSVLIFTLIRAPLKMCRNVMPNLFPLSISLSDPLVQASVDLMLLWGFGHVGLENLRPRTYVKAFLQRWLEAVGGMLDLTAYLFGNERQGENDDVIPNLDPQEAVEYDGHPSLFPVRIAILLLLAWSTISMIVGAFIMIPLLVGRVLFGLLPVPTTLTNDFYLHILGLYVIGGTLYSIMYVTRQAQHNHVVEFVKKLFKYSITGSKIVFLGSLWFVIIPTLAGLLFELTFLIPALIPVNKTPIIFLSEVWALGIFIMGIWIRLVYLFGLEPWKTELDNIKRDGIADINATRIFTNFILPILYALALIAFVPYIITRLILPLLFEAVPVMPYEEQLYFRNYLLRLFYPIFALANIVSVGAALIKKGFKYIHNTIYDKRYLVQQRLVNNQEQARAAAAALPQQQETETNVETEEPAQQEQQPAELNVMETADE